MVMEYSLIAEAHGNSVAFHTFEPVINALVWENRWKKEFEEGKVFIKDCIPEVFPKINWDENSSEMNAKAVDDAYNKLSEYKNELRNNILLMDTRVGNLVKPEYDGEVKVRGKMVSRIPTKYMTALGAIE